MEITGYKQRYIYPQTGIINYQASLSFDNITGVSYIGFSGEEFHNKVEFLAKSGKFYVNNSSGGLFLQSYGVNESISLSGAISPKTHDLFYNNSPLFLGYPRDTGYLNLFYVNSVNASTSLALTIGGDAPTYSYDPFESFYSGQSIPVNISNQSSLPFKIFSGNSLNPNFTLNGASNISVTGSETLFLQANNFSKGAQYIPIELFTDFGVQNLSFTASGVSLDNVEFYILFGPNVPTVQHNIQSKYTINCRNSTGIVLRLDLEYISGETGAYYTPIQATGATTGAASGLITGSGYISSFVSGDIYYNNSLVGIETGIGSGDISKFVYSSGDIVENYEIEITGLASGILSESFDSSGFSNIINQQVQADPRGSYHVFNNLTGLGTGIVNGEEKTGFLSGSSVPIFIRYTGLEESGISINIDSQYYHNIDFQSSIIFATGYFSIPVDVRGVAYATGGHITGVLQGDFARYYEPGYWSFHRYKVGSGSGVFATTLTGFDPIIIKNRQTHILGLISGNLSQDILIQNCTFELPEFLLTGTPDQDYYDYWGQTVPLVSTEFLHPDNSFESFINNSDFLTNSGNYVGDVYVSGDQYVSMGSQTPTGGRIRTSRYIPSLLGTGKFNNPIRFNDTSEADRTITPTDFQGWKEIISGYKTSQFLPDNYNSLSLGGDLYLENENDNAEIYFSLSGENCENINTNFNFDIENSTGLLLELSLYQKDKVSCSGYEKSLVKSYTGNWNYPAGILSGNSISNINDSYYFDQSCVGLGCENTGTYEVIFSGVSGCRYYDPLITGYISGNVIAKYLQSPMGGSQYVYRVGNEFESSGLYQHTSGFGVRRTSLTGEFGVMIAINSGYGLDRADDIYFVCSGSGCGGTGLYSGMYSYVKTGKYIYSTFTGNCSGRGTNFAEYYSGVSVEQKYVFGSYNEFGMFADCETSYSRFLVSGGTVSGFLDNFGISGTGLLTGTLIGIPTGNNVIYDCYGEGCTGVGRYSGYYFENIVNDLIYPEAYQKYAWFSGEQYNKVINSGVSSGVINYSDCSILHTGDVELEYLKQPIVDLKNYTQSLSSGNYYLTINYHKYIFPSGKQPPSLDPNYPTDISFSQLQYTGCEADRAVGFTVVRGGFNSFVYSGYLTFSRYGSAMLDQNEIYPDGYNTVIPFIFNSGVSSINLSIGLDDNGDWEQDETFKLNINDYNLSYDIAHVIPTSIFTIIDNDVSGLNTCVPTQPPGSPLGACCINTICSTTTNDQCLSLGGVFQGDYSSCYSVVCPEIIVDPFIPEKSGACCVGPACSILTNENCSLLGGIYQGDDSVCVGGLCYEIPPPPIDPPGGGGGGGGGGDPDPKDPKGKPFLSLSCNGFCDPYKNNVQVACTAVANTVKSDNVIADISGPGSKSCSDPFIGPNQGLTANCDFKISGIPCSCSSEYPYRQDDDTGCPDGYSKETHNESCVRSYRYNVSANGYASAMTTVNVTCDFTCYKCVEDKCACPDGWSDEPPMTCPDGQSLQSELAGAIDSGCTNTCYVCADDGACCCPGETGHECGNGCCCCGTYYAPVGIKCSCEYVG